MTGGTLQSTQHLTMARPDRDLVEVSMCCGAAPDIQGLRRCSACKERAGFVLEDADARTPLRSPSDALAAAAKALDESADVIERLLAFVSPRGSGRVRCELTALAARNSAKAARAIVQEMGT